MYVPHTVFSDGSILCNYIVVHYQNQETEIGMMCVYSYMASFMCVEAQDVKLGSGDMAQWVKALHV